MKFYETNVRSRNRTAFIAEKDGEIIGYVMGGILKRPPVYKTAHEARINDIVVTKKWRRRGVGTKLLEAFADWAREKGMKYVTLNVLPENKVGLKFYKKLEFETILVNQRKML